MVSKLKEQLEASLNEGKTAASELLDVRQQHDDTVRHLQEENSKLKEKNDQYEIRLREVDKTSLSFSFYVSSFFLFLQIYLLAPFFR